MRQRIPQHRILSHQILRRLRHRDMNRSGLHVSTMLVWASLLGTSVSLAACMADDEPAKVTNRAPLNTSTAASEVEGKEHPLVPYIKLARTSRDAVAALQDYEATFVKRELVGRTQYTGQMAMKLRQNPFAVYLRFVGNNAGREVMFAGPRYGNKLMAHEPPGTIKGIVGTVALDPKSPQAMAEGRHPINQIGMLNMVEALIHQWEEETKYGETVCEFYPNAKLTGPSGDTECKVIESTHPQPRRQFTFHRSRLYIEKKTSLPIRVEQWGFPTVSGAEPPLMEEYTYTDIRPNVGLTDNDFDIRNRNYRF